MKHLAHRRSRRRRIPAPLERWRWAAPLLLASALAGCDVDAVTLGSATGADARLHSGVYAYRSWSAAHAGLAWSGAVDLRVAPDGRISGTYRLPWQCSDARGWEADCVGRVGGRVYRDGTVRFGLDEGWLENEGAVDRFSEVRGRWSARLLGYSDRGTFELVRR